MKSKIISSLLILGIVGLSACSRVGFSGPEKTCPNVALVSEAAGVSQFIPGLKKADSNLVSRAIMSDFSSSCSYNSETADVTIDLDIIAERGNSMIGGTANYQYFVAITDQENNILNKSVYETVATFHKGEQRITLNENVMENMTLPSSGNPGEYKILLGFQLSKDELAYNRALK